MPKMPRQPKSEADVKALAMSRLAVEVDLQSLRTAPDAKPLSKAERRDLLSRLRAGEVIELDVDARVYRQSKTERPLPLANAKEANANFVVFREKDLGTLARSFKGRPLLRDHNRYDFTAAGGEITSGTLEESGDWYEMRQSLHLVKPWLVEAALDGTLRTFSISWDPKKRGLAGLRESVYCTVCNAPMFSASCSHWPGDAVEFPEGSGQRVLVEMQWRSVRGAETSAVSFPAVDGTAVEEVRAALAEARSDQPPTEEVANMPDEKKTDQAAEVADLKAELAATKEKLAAERAERAREAKERHAADVAALREKAIGEGLFKPGDGLDESFGDLAEISLDKAQKFVDSLKPTTPVGQPMQSLTAPAGPAGAQSEFEKLCDDEYGMPDAVKSRMPDVLKKLGLSEADFAKFGPHTTWGRN